MVQRQDENTRLYIPGRGNPKIAAIGGGHGLSMMLRGLKQHTRRITAIVSVADDGGGSGMLRDELGMLPPGDIRNCILALANTEPAMAQILDYRFTEGSLNGQSFGNLFLAAMNGISDTFDQAVRRMGEVLAITGQVLPVSNQDVHLEAEFENGRVILGESKIFRAKKEFDCKIRKVRLVPGAAALPESAEAILRADMVVLGPGSLYTSIIPNLLVDGIADALRETKAVKVLVLNVMTQDGETEGYTAPDHLRALYEHGGEGIVDVCLANTAPISEDAIRRYRTEGAEPLQIRREELERMGVRVVEAPIAAEQNGIVVHDSGTLAEWLLRILHESKN